MRSLYVTDKTDLEFSKGASRSSKPLKEASRGLEKGLQGGLEKLLRLPASSKLEGRLEGRLKGS